MEPEFFALDRLPLPSLKWYTVLSVLAASFSIYHIGAESESALRNLREKQERCHHFNSILIENTAHELNIASDTKFGVLENHANSIIISGSDNDSTNKNGPSDSSTLSVSSLGKFAARYFSNDYWWSAGGELQADIIPEQKNVTESDCFNDEEEEGYHDVTWKLVRWASQRRHCVWPLVNLVYCLLILGSHLVQQSVFGNLRSSEQENIKDQFWNLVFYKVVFVFGVVDVQEVEDAVGWCFFVSVIGFLQLARQLCQERHNYLIMVNDMTKSSEARRHRILRLLTFIFATSIFLFLAVVLWFLNSSPKEFSNDFLDLKSIIIPFTKPFEADTGEESGAGGNNASAAYDFNLGLHSAIFMLSEIGLLILQTMHALSVCLFDHMYFRLKTCKWNPFSLFADKAFAENDEEDLYLCASQDINYKFEIVSLIFDLIHHVHMFVCCNLFLSMTSLIVSLQMRLRVKQIHAVLKRRHSFTSLNEHIDRYSDVQHEDDNSDPDAYECDNCAICWETIASQKSKILPCNHTFHKTCLRKWLLVSMHCPTCRLSLLSEKEAQLRRENEPRRIYGPRPAYGIMGLLQTGQTLLDLFGGWDPLPDDQYPEPETTNSGPISPVSPHLTNNNNSVQELSVQVTPPSPDATSKDEQTPSQDEGTSCRTRKSNCAAS